MLSDAVVHPSLATADLARAKAWYADKLGMLPVKEFDGLLVYVVDGTPVTVYATPSAGTARHTVAAWVVDDLRATMARLRGRGLVFEDFDLGDLTTVDGVATDDDGNLNAWFRDADGNYLTIVEQRLADGDEPPARGVGAVLPASDLGRARAWYEAKLGLTPYRSYEGMLLVYREGLSRFSIYLTPSAGTARNTLAVWRVKSLRAEVAELRARGVVFEDYDFGDVRTVDGILTDDEGDENAWFKDSEGNVLALAQIHEDEGF